MKKFFSVYILISSIYIGFPKPLKGQDTSLVNSSVWTDIFFIQTLNDKFRYLIHSNYKVSVKNGNWQQIMIRPGIMYRIHDELQVQAGLHFFYTTEDDIKLYEFRTWQGMNVFFPRIGNIYLNNFFRLEQRFFWDNQGENIPFSLRGRYALSAFIPLNNKDIIKNTAYLWPNAEMFINLAGKETDFYIERERVGMGVGFAFSERFRTEMVYMNDWSREGQLNSFETTGHIYRIIFRYQLPYQKMDSETN